MDSPRPRRGPHGRQLAQRGGCSKHPVRVDDLGGHGRRDGFAIVAPMHTPPCHRPRRRTAPRLAPAPALSQLELAGEAEVSTRHLSFVETGRAAPSREMVLRLADRLDVPLRERNRLLAAAGFAPMFAERPLDDPALAAARDAVERILRAHEPCPALAVDRHWTLVAHNARRAAAARRRRRGAAGAAGQRAAPVPASGGPGAADRQPARLARAPARPAATARSPRSGDPVLAALLEELARATRRRAPTAAAPHGGGRDVVVPLLLDSDLGRLSFISTTTVFGTPVDVTAVGAGARVLLPGRRGDATALRALPRAQPLPPRRADAVALDAARRPRSRSGSCRSSAHRRQHAGRPPQERPSAAAAHGRIATARRQRRRAGAARSCSATAPRRPRAARAWAAAASRRIDQSLPLRAEHRGEQEGGLQGHADAFADDGMRLAGGVADAKDAVTGAEANARPDRPARRPGPFAHGAQRLGHAGALAPQHRFDRVAGAALARLASRSRSRRSSRTQQASVARPSSAMTMPP